MATVEKKKKRSTLGPMLRRQGFDESYYKRESSTGGGYWRVGCSQCQALCINGFATHETGCPNQTKAYRNEE